MTTPAIKVENVSKRYWIDHQKGGHDGLRHAMEAAFRNPIQWLGARKARRQTSREEFWALRDVCFEVKQGEVLGVIGRNGAGKSTLLKVLSRITEPSEGRISIDGRVASLLEVGTGFHPELTGRENIFLNGAILGMSRLEIKRKFDEIVAFSEIEKFLDTPVKRYSSGMYVRLAFAVAAHLEPEILVVDEVLAVGDAAFQQKCIGKMQDVSKGGRTVLFVSHQMAAISNLCSACLVLDKGRVDFHGPTEAAMHRYLETRNKVVAECDLHGFRPKWAKAYITSARILSLDGVEQSKVPIGSGFQVSMTYEAQSTLPPLRRPVMGVVVKHAIMGDVGAVNMRMTGSVVERGTSGGTITCRFEEIPLVQGSYLIDVWLGEGIMDVDMLGGYLSLTVEEADIYKSGQVPFPNMGAVYLKPEWKFT